MDAAEILADLANGGDPDNLPDLHGDLEDSEESLVQILASLAEETDEEATEPAVESPIVTDSSISRNSTPAFQGQTQEEVDIDLLIHGVKLPVSIKFQPLSLFCRKPAGLHLGVHV